MASENDDQRALRLWITAGLNIPEVADLKGNASYLFNNMIAKYTLYNSSYLISEAALQLLLKEGVDMNATHLRRRFYGKDKPYLYEHSIPAKIVRTELLDCDRTETTIKNILKHAGKVSLILRDEDLLLRESKFGSSMPSGWKFYGDEEARYHAVGIQISKNRLKVKGAIVR